MEIKLSKTRLEDYFVPHIDKYRRIQYEGAFKAANTNH